MRARSLNRTTVFVTGDCLYRCREFLGSGLFLKGADLLRTPTAARNMGEGQLRSVGPMPKKIERASIPQESAAKPRVEVILHRSPPNLQLSIGALSELCKAVVFGSRAPGAETRRSYKKRINPQSGLVQAS